MPEKPHKEITIEQSITKQIVEAKLSSGCGCQKKKI